MSELVVRRLLIDLDSPVPRHWFAITAATEHFTAVFAEWMLQNPDLFDGSETRLKTLWLWHSAEKSEHITFLSLLDLLRQTVNNLYRDGSLWQWRTWKSAASFLFGKQGMIRLSYQPWRAYKKN